LKDIDQAEFAKNPMVKWASIKELEIIGEAANHISEETKKLAKNIPWDKIVGMRNILVHEYFGVDIEIAWTILVKDMPDLKIEVKKMLKVFSSRGLDI